MAGRPEVAGRRLLTTIVTRLLPPRPAPTSDRLGMRPERVLLVRHDDRIGNLVLMTSLIRGARELWPEAEIGVLIGPRFPQVLQEEEEIDRFWILEKRRILRNPLRFFVLLRRLRRRRHDVAFDCSHMHSFSLTGAAMTYFSGAPLRVAYDRGSAEAFCNLLVEPLGAEHHESEILLNLLRPFTDALPRVSMGLRLSPEERAWAAAALLQRGIGPGATLLGLHVGGRGAKRWPIDRHVAVLERVLERHRLSPLVFCGPGERSEGARMRSTFGSRIRVFEDLDIRQLVALIERCDHFISPDTGPMHIAAALGVPTTAIFLEKAWRRYGPPGELHEIVHVTAEGGEDAVVAALERQLSRHAEHTEPNGSDADTE